MRRMYPHSVFVPTTKTLVALASPFIEGGKGKSHHTRPAANAKSCALRSTGTPALVSAGSFYASISAHIGTATLGTSKWWGKSLIGVGTEGVQIESQQIFLWICRVSTECQWASSANEPSWGEIFLSTCSSFNNLVFCNFQQNTRETSPVKAASKPKWNQDYSKSLKS